MPRFGSTWFVLMIGVLCPFARAQVLPPIQTSPLVLEVIDDPITSEDQRLAMRLFHGQWEALDQKTLTLNQTARLALLRSDLHHAALTTDGVDPLLIAQAALQRGDPAMALTQLATINSAQSALLKAQAYEQLGDIPQATQVLTPWRKQLLQAPFTDPAQLTAAAQGLVMLARLEGRPGQDYQLALDLLAKVRTELDPLYWPASLAEARILEDKDNRAQAIDALAQVLSLNPKSGQAYGLLGKMATTGFDFERASAIVERLHHIHPQHLQADLIQTRSLIWQKDTKAARAVLASALKRDPDQRALNALSVAVEAMDYHQPGVEAALARYEALSPGSPDAYFMLGQALSLARQYEQAQVALRQAIARQPNASAARIELGLLLVQAGQLEQAQRELADAARLDPFNRRAANTLAMVDQLLGYEVLQTDHFIIRYKPGIDAALAHDMPEELERIYRDITGAFGFKPTFKTQIDLMPDEKSFGVRITGMPDIWTIAAATGPAIAMTPPREGAKQRGPFDWPNVIRHEFVHVVTLTQTDNRLPHWFTEACAVNQEVTGRLYENARLLAWAVREDELFDYDELNWGFIRPTRSTDRPLAYAQSQWMLQYLTQTLGHQAVLDMLELYRQGIADRQVLQTVTGQTPQAFMADFKKWAQQQVHTWGLDVIDVEPRAAELITGKRQPDDDAELNHWLNVYPNHPELLKIKAQRAIDDPLRIGAQEAIEAYARVRPTDPWPHQKLVGLALEAGQLDAAISSLESLDQVEQTHGDYAFQLAKFYRDQGQLDSALRAIQRALHREPYRATYRQWAATIALQKGDLPQGLVHLQALALIEPGQAIHQTRLAAMYHRMKNVDAAHAHAIKARELDANAPVDAFLKPTP